MLFDSPAFVAFLIPVVLIFWRLDRRSQNVFLLAASYVFYGWWDWRFLALMAGSTVIDYLIAQRIAATAPGRRRKAWLIFSLALNLTVLGIFKYFNFFVGSAVALFSAFGLGSTGTLVLRVVLPP